MTQTCRHCATPLTLEFLDLGHAPPSNAYLSEADLTRPEQTFPLRLMACTGCRLVQTLDFSAADELFTEDYAYFSSTSQGWLNHAAAYVSMIADRLGLDGDSHVTEVASNDGYLLRNFVARGIPCLGIEPTRSTAIAAEALGIPVRQEFFGEAMAATVPASDLIIGNNVYAHVPDINDFTRGLARALKPQGVITLEFPHLMRLVEFGQFDTVYHEHYSYLSLMAVERIFKAAGLAVFDVEELSTHGGSLRVYGGHAGAHEERAVVATLRALETARGMDTDAFYEGFQPVANRIKDDFLRFLLDARAAGRTVAGYGAAAKGNTLMNYAGVRPDLMPYVCDAAPAKIGTWLPGSHIPVRPPAALREAPPDYVVILPWNIADEVAGSLADLTDTQLVTFVPERRYL